MILLNDDEKELRAQIDYLKKYALTCTDPIEVFGSVQNYCSLLSVFSKHADLEYIKSFPRDVRRTYSKEEKEFLCKVKSNLKENREFHIQFLRESFRIVDALKKEMKGNSVLSDSYCDYVFKEDYDVQLLHSFFREEDIVLWDIFQDMKKAGRIYINKSSESPMSFYNNLQDIPNIFLPEGDITYVFLRNLIHELGHIKTEMQLNYENSGLFRQYSNQSLYPEVMAYYYEQKFDLFLLSNHIVQKEVATELFDTLDFVSHNLKCNRNLFQLGIYSSQSLFSNMQYSYGPMIAASLCSSNELTEAFCKIQHEPFSKETLDSLGLTTEKVGHDFQKQMRSYFKS